MQLARTRYFYPITILFLLAALFGGLVITMWQPKADHAHASIPYVDNGQIGWPFVASEASWQIGTGYDARKSPDHNCYSLDCYERYGFDFIATNRSAAGLTVNSPATGPILAGYIWPAKYKQGVCFTISLGNNNYVMTCHVVLDNPNVTYAYKGVRIGSVYDAGSNSHIHMNLFSSPDPSLSTRSPIPFSDPWMIQGCNYQLAPGETTDPSYYYSDWGYHSGETVPCNNQGGAPNLTFQWGSTAWPSQGIYLNRNVLVEVRNTIDSPDLFHQVVPTDSNGTATLGLTGISPGYYTVLIKPTGFLRQSTNMMLQAGSNSASFPMTVSSTGCDGKPTGPQLWIGDVNGDNVINSTDYNIIYNYFDKPVPSGYVDLDGEPAQIFDGIDYNLWLRSICFFGGGSGEVVGVGGRMDTPIGQAAQIKLVKASSKPSTHKIHTSGGGGALSLWPYTGNYRVGQSFSLSVQASVPVPLTGADMVIHYNPKVLSVTSSTPSNIFPSTLVNANNPVTGEINISSVSNPGQPINVGISATLATIQFQVIGSGQTDVVFDFNANSSDRSSMSESGVDTQILSYVYNATFTAGILHVPQDYATIKQALAAAQPQETVLVSPGTYHEQFQVPSNVTLQGQDPTSTIIDGDGIVNQAVVYLGNGSSISNVTIQHSGTNFWDAAIWADQGPVTISNTHLFNNSMGIVRYCYSPPCTDTSTITNNLVANNAYTGILIHGAQAVVQNNTVVTNKLQGITFESSAQGSCIENIVAFGGTGLTATSSTLLINNLLWKNTNNYDPSTTPGANDVIAAPLFINAPLNDYRVHAASASIDFIGTKGAYNFVPTGPTPTNLAIAQTTQGVVLSWQTTGAAAGYAVCIDKGMGFFGQCFNAGNTSSYTFKPSSLSGSVRFAVSSYNAQLQESFPAYFQATTAAISVSPAKGVYNQTILVTGSNFGTSELLNIYIDNTGTFPVTSVSTTSTGAFTAQFQLPQATYGKHSIIAQGFTSTITASTVFTVKPKTALLYGSGAHGSQNTITGYGFTANEVVKVYWATNGGLLLGTATANSLGTATLNFTVPTAAPGSYKIYMVGQTSGATASSTFKLTS